MRSNYDIYEFREVTDKDACADYSSMGMLAPVLTQFSPTGIKWGMVWGYFDRIHGLHKHARYLRLMWRRNERKCLPLTEEFYKRVLDVTPMGTWK